MRFGIVFRPLNYFSGKFKDDTWENIVGFLSKTLIRRVV